MVKRYRIAALAVACVCLAPLEAVAQDSAEVLNRMKAMEDRIKSLETEIQDLKSQQAATTAALTAATPAVPAPAVAQAQPAVPSAPVEQAAAQPSVVLGGAGGAAAKVLNPDIAVIGDFLGAAGNGAGRPTPSLEMHESEVAFQAILDPYARADFFISFGEHGVDLEEGYLTFPALPGHLELRVGKMRAAFGKVNTLHNHVLPWTDRPLVITNLVGGEDGINDAGLAVSRIFQGPGQVFLEGTAEIFRGDSFNLFQAYNRNDLSTVEHLRAYRDLSESTNLDIGGSYSRGHSVFGPTAINQIFGIDATVRWKPLRRSIYHSFVGRSELIWSRLSVPEQSVTTPFGFYVSGDYQFARRWFVGGRFDRSQRLDHETLLQDTGGSLVLTYWPSEFSQIRGQLRRTRYGENLTANEFLFQFQFSIGAHGAHPF
jgi:cell division protein FtsB